MKLIFVKLIGELYLAAQRAGEYIAVSKIKKRLHSCGNNVKIDTGCHMIPEHVSLGDNVSIGYASSLMASIAHIYIGNNVMLAPGVVIRGGNHRTDVIGKTMFEITDAEKLPENDADVYIEDDVWIGQNAIILKGVTIGRGSVIGAGTIVTKDVPPYSIFAGVPGRQIRSRFTAEQIEEHERMLASRKR